MDNDNYSEVKEFSRKALYLTIRPSFEELTPEEYYALHYNELHYNDDYNEWESNYEEWQDQEPEEPDSLDYSSALRFDEAYEDWELEHRVWSDNEPEEPDPDDSKYSVEPNQYVIINPDYLYYFKKASVPLCELYDVILWIRSEGGQPWYMDYDIKKTFDVFKETTA